MARAQKFEPIDVRRARGAWRLTFRFDGTDVELASSERVRMIAPPSSGPPPASGEKRSGAWIELQGKSGRTVFHRGLHDPFRTRAEVHSPEGEIRLAVRQPEPCEFQAIVPDVPDATTAVLFSSPPEPERSGEPATKLGSFELTDAKPPDEPPARSS